MSGSGFLFGPFRLDTEAQLLLRGEAVVPLTPKSIEILLLLVKNAGRVVEKEELMKTVWPDPAPASNRTFSRNFTVPFKEVSFPFKKA